MHTVAICAIVKNEYDYLLEWIAYHQAVKVDHFLIYNNSDGNDDGTTQLLNQLEGIGAVEVVPWPDRPHWPLPEGLIPEPVGGAPAEGWSRPQIPAYHDGIRRLKDKTSWVAFIDVDEFIVPMKEEDLPSTLRLYQQFGGIGVNWRVFGSSGETKKEPFPVCMRFTMASPRQFPANSHVKSIVKPDMIRDLNSHRPFLSTGSFVDERGRVITDWRGIHNSISDDIIRINHYFTKSYEEWLLKTTRGMADRTGKRPDDSFYRFDNGANHDQDTSILRFYEATVRKMRAMASAAGIKDYPCLTNGVDRVGGPYFMKFDPAGLAERDQPVLAVHLIGNLAQKMMQYMVVRRIASEVEGCRISNVVLPEWGINHPPVPGEVSRGDEVPASPDRVDITKLKTLFSSGKQGRINFKSYSQWFPNFPSLDICRSLFPANQPEFPGYGSEYLVCHLEVDEIQDARARNSVLLPIEFYAELAETTALKLVFLGKIRDNAYCRALQQRFPDAVFHASRGPMADFQTLRNSRNLVPAISPFSWLASWLSHAEVIILSVSGLFHPVQCPDIDLLPYADERYRFYLFPINYRVPIDQFEEAHRALQGGWRFIRSETIPQLRVLPNPKRMERFLPFFDENYYLRVHPDVARACAAGLKSLDHYVACGFREGRNCFALDDHWYSRQYPIAAFEVGQGDYADLRHHYIEVGMIRGYRPVPHPSNKVAEPVQSLLRPVPTRYKKYKIAICMIVRRERDYLLEWVAYHKIIGVDRFLIYDNANCEDDGTTDLLHKLQSIGVIEVVPWPDRVTWQGPTGPHTRPQIPAYYDGIRRLRSEAEWVAFIDADEFIVPMKESDLPSALRQYQQFGGVGANWRVFGSGGAKTKENSPVCKRFTMASSAQHADNACVKSITKPELIRDLNVHRPFLENGIFVDEHGSEITDARGFRHPVSYDFIRINHYMTKSYEEWQQKFARGSATRGTFDKPEKKPGTFARFDHNHEVDTFILKFYDSMVQEMMALASKASIEHYPVIA